MRTVLIALLMVVTVGTANAYFRCNTTKCKEARLADREERLAKVIATTHKEDVKNKAEVELETTISEIKRIDEAKSATAHNH